MEAQVGVLTAASLLWTLQSLLVMRSVDRRAETPRLGLYLQFLTVLAAVSISLSLLGVTSIVFSWGQFWMTAFFLGSMGAVALLLTWISLYYFAILGAVIDRDGKA